MKLADGLTVVQAGTWRARLKGLAGAARLQPGVALRLSPCRSVHTAGMRFALDLVWLDADGGVARVDEDVGAWRTRSCRAARSVLETNAGEGQAFAAAVGESGYTSPC